MSRWSLPAVLLSLLSISHLAAEEKSPPKEKPALKAAAEKIKSEAGGKALVKPATTPAKIEPLTEKTIKDRASYAIGVNFGSYLLQGIKDDRADVDMEMLIKGVRDALTKPKPEFTDAELTAAIEAFDKALEAKNSATSRATAEKNKKEGEAFLAKNKEEQGVHTTASGLQYKVLKSGTGKSPAATDVVRVHYHGTLPDGTAFDSSTLRGEAVEFPVTSVIKGWSEALLSMKVGDKWKLYIPSELAYGARRRSDVVGPNQVVVFDVELLEIVAGKKVNPVKSDKAATK
ncbi:MAG: FKBP-type peptidyl-prolyl cis-trans isomerase [Planctomycetales bacterium]|nr:FKBP-type peptidyl-prolyl cis-trans isomerase [Planctomycetales bacterium]